MKAILTARMQHMAASDILAMVPADTLARIKATDATPEIRAYAIAHEGEAEGNMVGLGKRVMQYFRDAILRLHDQLRLGTPIFKGHGADNSHAGREPIGELVGKALRNIGGTLHDIAAIYVAPQFQGLTLDIASIEAEVQFTEGDGGMCRAVDIGEITGIALGCSKTQRPGFSGATLLAAVQAFAGRENAAMTKEEVLQAIAELKLKPGDVFGIDALTADPGVHDKIEKTGREAARRVKEEEADKLREQNEALSKKLQNAERAAVVSRAGSVIETLAASRKLTEQQLAFAKRNAASWKPEADTEEALTVAANKFLDGQLTEFAEVAKLLGAEPKAADDKGAPSGDGLPVPDGKDLADPANNPLIPA